MRCACIDIGSNTTRLLVAECDGTHLQELHQARAFTRIGKALLADRMIPAAKQREVVGVVAAQLASARALGVTEIRGVATASIRQAANGGELIAAIAAASGLAVRVLSEQEEARLAFIGAVGMLEQAPAGELAVVDVGGGSSEIAVGTAPDRVRWTASFAVGSGAIADRCLHSDPPSSVELDDARTVVADILGRVVMPKPTEIVAVGGSATSLGRVTGSRLDAEAFGRALGLLASAPAADVARRFELAEERVRLLPAGLVILEAASRLFGAPLKLGRGGVREGVLLETAR